MPSRSPRKRTTNTDHFTDYNAVLSVFYVSYIIFEIPLNILCKKIGPGWFLPATTLAFGICSLGTAFVHTFSQVCAVRFLLGRDPNPRKRVQIWI
jgi:MFS family permease